MKKFLILILINLSLAAAPSILTAQEGDKLKSEVAIGYSYLHTNAPPGGCGCFSMNGADAQFGYAFTPHWTGLADFGWVYNGKVDAYGSDLLLEHYLAGVRYRVKLKSRIRPFAELEAGNTNAYGSASPGSLGIGHNNVFSIATGGGLDWPLSKHLAWRVVDADYLLTLFHNSKNDLQNNMRVTTGIVFKFGK